MAKKVELTIDFERACNILGVSQKELSSMINYTNQSISDFKTGSRKVPKIIDVLHELSIITKEPIDNFIVKKKVKNIKSK